MKIITLLILSVFFIACGGRKDATLNSGGGMINGAGATFPYPLYSKWFDEYSKIDKNAKINYQSIGSGGGIKQITEGTVDFGATDSPMNEEELNKAVTKNNSEIFHIPTVIGSVVLTYNIPEVQQKINLSGEAIAGIYLGKIKKWNDPIITKENSGVNLPDKEIIPVYRTDGSGTTFVFTDYLGKVSSEWKAGPGTAKDVRFNAGQGAKGNEGVTGLVKQLPYSIGYVELIYALQNELQFANIKNASNEYITPSLESLTKAADATLSSMPEDMRVSITNASGSGAYPISSYTYILIYKNQTDEAKGKIMKSFLTWALNDGKKFASELGYAPLPESVTKKALDKIILLNYKGNTL